MGAAAAEGKAVAKGVVGGSSCSSSSISSSSSIAAGIRETMSLNIKSAEILTTIRYDTIKDYRSLSILVECF